MPEDDKPTYTVELDIPAMEWMIKMVHMLNENKAGMGPNDWHLPDEIPVMLSGEPTGYTLGLSEFYGGQYAIRQEFPRAN